MFINELIETTRFYKSFLYSLPLVFLVNTEYALSLLFFLLFSYIFNDFVDAEKDKLGHPERPIPSGRLERNFAGKVSVILLLLAMIIPAVQTSQYLITFLGALLLSVLYSAVIKPSYPALATIFWATAVSLATVSGLNLGWIFTAGFTFIVYGYEILLDVRDVDSDSKYYTKPTIAVILNRHSIFVSSTLLLLGVLMLVYSLYETNLSTI